MPKYNFNVPFVNTSGEAVVVPKYEKKKIKVSGAGEAIMTPVLDNDGYVVQETVTVKDELVKILNMRFPGDDAMTFSDRAKRGRLARKLETSSTASYRVEDLTVIQDLAAKAASTALLMQLDDIINGKSTDSDSEESEKNDPDKTEA